MDRDKSIQENEITKRLITGETLSERDFSIGKPTHTSQIDDFGKTLDMMETLATHLRRCEGFFRTIKENYDLRPGLIREINNLVNNINKELKDATVIVKKTKHIKRVGGRW